MSAALDLLLHNLHNDTAEVRPIITEPSPRKEKGVVHVSSAMRCRRRTWALSHGQGEPAYIPLATRLLFDWGNTTHRYIQTKAHYLGAEVEVSLDDGTLVGSIDILLMGEVFELKTSAGIANRKLPYASHVMQAAIYHRMLGTDAEHFHLLYVDRINGHLAPFTMAYGPIAAHVDAEIAVLKALVHTETMPDGTPGWECDTCPIRLTCDVVNRGKALHQTVNVR